MDTAFELHEVVKKFGDVVSLDGVSMRARPAAVMALLGPNGSGKTTVVNRRWPPVSSGRRSRVHALRWESASPCIRPTTRVESEDR